MGHGTVYSRRVCPQVATMSMRLTISRWGSCIGRGLRLAKRGTHLLLHTTHYANFGTLFKAYGAPVSSLLSHFTAGCAIVDSTTKIFLAVILTGLSMVFYSGG